MRLAVLAILAATPVPCSQQQPLPPALVPIAHHLDADGERVLQPNTSWVHNNGMLMYPRIDADAAGRMRTRLQMNMCVSPITAKVTISTRTFYVTPEQKAVFGVYEVQVAEVLRGAGIAAGNTIKVIREGGAVCTSAGRLEVIDRDRSVLELGESYLLMLTPAENNHYLTSNGDWHLGTTAKLAQDLDEAHEIYTVPALLAAARSMTCEDIE